MKNKGLKSFRIKRSFFQLLPVTSTEERSDVSQISSAQLSPADHWDPGDVKPVIAGKNASSSLQTVSFLGTLI